MLETWQIATVSCSHLKDVSQKVIKVLHHSSPSFSLEGFEFGCEVCLTLGMGVKLLKVLYHLDLSSLIPSQEPPSHSLPLILLHDLPFDTLPMKH